MYFHMIVFNEAVPIFMKKQNARGDYYTYSLLVYRDIPLENNHHKYAHNVLNIPPILVSLRSPNF